MTPCWQNKSKVLYNLCKVGSSLILLSHWPHHFHRNPGYLLQLTSDRPLNIKIRWKLTPCSQNKSKVLYNLYKVCSSLIFCYSIDCIIFIEILSDTQLNLLLFQTCTFSINIRLMFLLQSCVHFRRRNGSITEWELYTA